MFNGFYKFFPLYTLLISYRGGSTKTKTKPFLRDTTWLLFFLGGWGDLEPFHPDPRASLRQASSNTHAGFLLGLGLPLEPKRSKFFQVGVRQEALYMGCPMVGIPLKGLYFTRKSLCAFQRLACEQLHGVHWCRWVL